MRVRTATLADRDSWNSYVQEKAKVEPQLAHHAYDFGWSEILHDVFGHEPHYLLAETGGVVDGVLPLFKLSSLLFGRSLISVPYLNAGGIVANNEAAFLALLESATKLSADLNTSYMELRSRQALSYYPSEMPHRSHKAAVILPISEPENTFSSFKAKLRSQIRRPSKSGVYAKTSKTMSLSSSLIAFYEVFSRNMRDLGTPVYPRQLFAKALEHFGKRASVITVWYENKPIAAGITLAFGQSVEMPWASSLKRYNHLSPNMLLYWEAMKLACEDGYTQFDFGRSSLDSGAFRFKEQWGGTSLPLHWYYHLNSGETPNVNPDNPSFSFLVKCWKYLPLPIANTVGPRLTRGVP